MTGPHDRPDADELPVGTDADEAAATATATDDAAAAGQASGDVALAEAGLPREGRPDTGRPPHRASLAHRLYNGEAGLDVVGRSRLIYRVTAVVLLLCLAAMVFRGFNFGIDFAGGNSLRLPGSTAQLEQVQEAAEDAGAEVASAQVVGGNTLLLRTAALDNDTERAVVDAVAAAAGVEPSQVSPESVSPEWGQDITRQALVALAVFLVAVIAFLAIRFQPKMASARSRAAARPRGDRRRLLAGRLRGHAVDGHRLLTILGLLPVRHRRRLRQGRREHQGPEQSARMTWGEAANLAVNQTLMRSINTSVIALLPVAGLLFVGAGLLGVGTLKDLALVLFVGLAAGAYSVDLPGHADRRRPQGARAEAGRLRRRVLARRVGAARPAPARSPARSPAPAAPAAGPAGGASRWPSGTSTRSGPRRPTSSSSRRRRCGPGPARGATAAPRPGSAPAAAGRRAPRQEAPVTGGPGAAPPLPLDELVAGLAVDVPDFPTPGCSSAT
jgi:preprotein translocase subunit SecF